MQEIKILTAGDSSLLVEFGQEISPEINRKITATVQLMKEQHIEGVLDIIPAFCSLLINYDPRVISYDELKGRMKNLLKVEIKAEAGRKRGRRTVCRGYSHVPDAPADLRPVVKSVTGGSETADTALRPGGRKASDPGTDRFEAGSDTC